MCHADAAGLNNGAGTVLTCPLQMNSPTLQKSSSEADEPDTWENVPLVAIPYYAWAHRGPGEMISRLD